MNPIKRITQYFDTCPGWMPSTIFYLLLAGLLLTLEIYLTR